MRSLLVFAVAIFAVSVAGSAEWLGFRGPNGSAVSPEKGLPTTWSKTEGLKYTVDLPGRGLSNPVIANGRIFLTACSGYRERRLHVLCLEESTGKKLWERQLEATGNTACHPMTNMAAPTPVASSDGKSVYALFATGDLIAFDRDGTMLWYRSMVSDYPNITNQVGMASSPMLSGKTLLLPLENAGDSFAAGISTETGKNLWKAKRTTAINWVTPVLISEGGKQAALFVTKNDATAFDPATGKVVWEYSAEDLGTIPSPTYGGGLVYVPGGQTRALKPSKTGTPEVVWETANVSQGFSSPVYYEGKLYGLAQGTVNCFDAKTGKEQWRQRITGPFSGSPVVADGKLYAVNNKGKTYVVELGEKPTILAQNDLEDTILATPAIANGCIYLRSDKKLYCIGAKK